MRAGISAKARGSEEVPISDKVGNSEKTRICENQYYHNSFSSHRLCGSVKIIHQNDKIMHSQSKKEPN